MVALNGPKYVAAPNPVVPRYGLFQVATGPLDLEQHARIGGLQYELSACTLPNGYEVQCQTSLETKTFDGDIETKIGYPFVVYSGITCGTVGLANYGQERIRKYLYEQLVAGEQATVESIFSTSGFGQTEGLANNPAVVDLGTAQGPVQAVSILEDWLYTRYGLPGVIHAPVAAAAYLSGAHLLHRDTSSQPWRTNIGTWVSLGNYAGVGPTGQTPGTNETYMYITGQVAVWRTPDSQLLDIPLGQIINRSTNEVEILMEREYIVTYDCFVATVLVTLDTTDQ